MSDIVDFRPHSVLQHRSLEAVVFQWDGTKDQAMAVTNELQRELTIRAAELVGSTFSGDISVKLTRSVGQVDATDKRTWSVHIHRRDDDKDFGEYLAPHDWLVLWLFEERLYDVQKFSADTGDRIFTRIRPVVTLRPRHPEVTT